MRFSEDFIERVRDANNIVDLISQHTQLRPMAGGYMGRCPFPDHQEKTASFSVSESKQVYHCFGCRKKGNIFSFIMEFNGLSFPETIEFLAHRANISLPVELEPETGQQDLMLRKRKAVIQLNHWALQYYRENFQRLPKDHPVRVYAEDQRGLQLPTIKEFQIGYAGKDWDGLARWIEKKIQTQAGELASTRGWTLSSLMSLAEEAWLLKRRSGNDSYGDGYLDKFRDRLMFPILNPMGEPLGFGGRIIDQGEPKYLNSGETPVFNKGKVLYGLAHTAKFARSEDRVLVVEGYMDLVSLFQVGIRNSVAPMGTALTPDQCRILSRMTKNVIVLFDGDEAGQRAAERSLPILLAAGVHPKGLILPEGLDPDDFVKQHGAEALSTLISTAPDLFSLVLGLWLRGYRGEASDKVKMSDQLQPIFASVQDQRLKRLYLQEAAGKLKVEENWLRDALRSQPGRPIRAIPTQSLEPHEPSLAQMPSAEGTENSVQRVSLQGVGKIESALLSLVLKKHSNFKYFESSGGFEFVTHPGARTVLEKAAIASRQGVEKFDKLAGLLTSFVDRPEILLSEPLGRNLGGKLEDFASGVTNENLAADGSENFAPGAAAEDRMAMDIALEKQQEQQQEAEAKYLGDCLKRLKDQYLKIQADTLAAEIKLQPTSEKLQKLMSIQRDRLAINKEP